MQFSIFLKVSSKFKSFRLAEKSFRPNQGVQKTKALNTFEMELCILFDEPLGYLFVALESCYSFQHFKLWDGINEITLFPNCIKLWTQFETCGFLGGNIFKQLSFATSSFRSKAIRTNLSNVQVRLASYKLFGDW